MLRTIALFSALLSCASATAAPPAAPKYLDDVDGLARLAWQATRCPDPGMRLAAVEQMVRLCAHPKRVDMVLATIEAKESVEVVRASAQRVRMQLRLETANWAWIEAEEAAAEGRSVVAHDPIPYREALAAMREAPSMPSSPTSIEFSQQKPRSAAVTVASKTGMESTLPKR
jgi:hypothetical protein